MRFYYQGDIVRFLSISLLSLIIYLIVRNKFAEYLRVNAGRNLMKSLVVKPFNEVTWYKRTLS